MKKHSVCICLLTLASVMCLWGATTTITKEFPLTEETKELARQELLSYQKGPKSGGLVVLREEWDENARKKEVRQRLLLSAPGRKYVTFYLRPESLKGRGSLQIERNIWSYNPERRTFSLSIDHYADLSGMLIGDESKYELTGYFEGSCNGYDAHMFRIVEKDTQKILELWFDTSTTLMLLNDQSSTNGSLLQRDEYIAYVQLPFSGAYYCSELRRWDFTQPDSVWYWRTLDIKEQDIPDDYFTKSYVEQVCR